MKKTFLLTCIVTFLLSTNTASAAWFGKKKDTETPVATEETNLAAEDNANAALAEDTVVLTPDAVTAAPASTPEPAPAPTAAATTAPAPEPSAPVVVAQTTPPRATSAPSSVNKNSTVKKKPAAATSSKKRVVKASTKKPASSRPAATKRPATAAPQNQQPAASNKITPAELQARAEAKKSVAPVVSMAETKAYELFKDGNYDVAAPYFARMATEKNFVYADDMQYERIDNIVRKYVDAQMAKFLVKGEFEKTAAYIVRVNEASRNKKIQSFADNIFGELKSRERKLISIRDFRLSRYYADDESFLLSSPVGDYVLAVEMAGARSFKSNFYKLQLKDLDFTADTSGTMVLSRFTVVNPDNKKQYLFNSGLSTQYNIADLENFYTSRLGKGTPKSTQAVTDTVKAFRSVAPSVPAADTTKAANTQNPFGTNSQATPAQSSSTSQPAASSGQAQTEAATTTTTSTAAPQQQETPAPPAEEAKVKISGDEMTLEN